MIYIKNDDTNVIVSQVLTNEESSYINSLSAIPIIVDNDRYVVDNTYINRISEDYDISREESISLLESTNNIDNLTIAISDIDSIIDSTLLTESSNFIIYPQSELTEEYDYYEDILQSVFDEDNESLLEYLDDIDDDFDILNERQVSKEDLEKQKERLNKSMVYTGNLPSIQFVATGLPDEYKKALIKDGKVNAPLLNRIVKLIKQDDDSDFTPNPLAYKTDMTANKKLESKYGKGAHYYRAGRGNYGYQRVNKFRNKYDDFDDSLDHKSRKEFREYAKKVRDKEAGKVYKFDTISKNYKVIDKFQKGNSRNLNLKNSEIPEKYRNDSNYSKDSTDDMALKIFKALGSRDRKSLLKIHSAEKHNKKLTTKLGKINKRLGIVPKETDNTETNEKKKETTQIESPKEKEREVVTVQKQGEKTKSDSPRDGETVKDTAKRLSTQNQPLQLDPNDKKQQQEQPKTEKPKEEDKPTRVIPSPDKKTEESPKPTQAEPAKPAASSTPNKPSSTATVPPAVKQDLNKDKTNISRIAKIGGGLAAAGGAYAAARKIASLKNLQNKWARKLLLLPPAKRGIVQRIIDKIKQTIAKLSKRLHK